MKSPALVVLGFLLLVDVSAQSSQAQPNAPELTVTKKFWRKELYHPALTSDPFRVNDEQMEMQRAQRDNNIRNSVRVREGTTPQPAQSVRNPKPMPTESEAPRMLFVYRVTVKNSGTKTITGLVWEYVFFDPERAEQVGQHSFLHRVKIRSGKSMELIGESVRPPTRVIDANKKGESRLTEEVVIRRIEYEDGSVWQRPVN